MTNEQIIFAARCDLMEKGKIGTTGRKIEFHMGDGTTKYVPEPEQIHTYQFWKTNFGMVPKKGTHAIATLNIWKCKKNKKNEKKNDDEDEDENEKLFLGKAFFFSSDQVEKIEGGQKK